LGVMRCRPSFRAAQHSTAQHSTAQHSTAQHVHSMCTGQFHHDAHLHLP
jgi:hypothetical protein